MARSSETFGYADRDEYPVQPAFIDELINQCQTGPGVELPTAKMFQTLLSYHETQPIQFLLSEASALMIDRGIKPGAAISGLRTTLVHYFRSRYQESHPGTEFPDAELVSVEDWKPCFDMLVADAQADAGSMAANYLFNAGIYFLDAVTPIKERYWNFELLAQLVRERFPNGIRALDYGSSVMAGPLFLMNKGLFKPAGFDSVVQKVPNKKEIDLTAKANEIITRPTPFNKFVCVDIFNVYYETSSKKTYDTAFVQHAISGLRPSERNDPAYLSDLKQALSIKQADQPGAPCSSGVTFERASFLEPSDLEQFKAKYPEPFDMIVMNYVTQELSPKEQLQLHRIALSLLSENGLLVYNHQAFIPEGVEQPAPVDRLRHYGSYATRAWLSNAHVVDNNHPVQGLQEMLNYYDNRCRRVRTATGTLALNGSLVPIADSIKNG